MRLKPFLFCWTSAVVFWMALILFPGAAAAAGPDLVTELRRVENLSFCGEAVPLAETGIRERMEKELLLAAWDRPQVILWLKRSRRCFPVIAQVLAENDLPGDLKYIPIIESALRPHAASRKGAVGFWQFMPHTARRYGLRVDERIDERRNLAASTHAAVRYLKDLFAETGSWTLAAAAFNMGEEGVRAESMVQRTDNFYHLYLPLETQRFVFRILAAKRIMTDPEAFGFVLQEEDYYRSAATERIHVNCFDDVPLQLVAEAAQTRFKVLKDLNPEIRGHYLAAGRHQLAVPRGGAADFEPRYARLLTTFQQQQEQMVYIVKSGDNLSLIAERFDVPLAALIIWNRINLDQPIHPGDRLWIQPPAEAP